MTQKDCLKNLALRYLNKKEWNYTVKQDSDDAFIVVIRFNLQSKIKECVLNVVVTDRYILSWASCPIKATEDVRDKVVEFITRANLGITIGSFQYNYDLGDVSFRAAMSTIEGEPSLQDLDRVIRTPLNMLDWFGNGLIKNLMGFGDPKADVEEAKKS